MTISPNFEIFAPLVGGLIIGLATSLLLYLNGKVAGISSITKDILTIPHYQEKIWRALFVLGLISGGFFVQLNFPERLHLEYSPNIILSIIGGLLVGIGTSLGNGCTSGHGICGITRLSKRSIIATITFMISGMLTVFLINQFGLLV